MRVPVCPHSRQLTMFKYNSTIIKSILTLIFKGKMSKKDILTRNYLSKEKAVLKNPLANIIHVYIIPEYLCCMSCLFILNQPCRVSLLSQVDNGRISWNHFPPMHKDGYLMQRNSLSHLNFAKYIIIYNNDMTSSSVIASKHFSSLALSL